MKTLLISPNSLNLSSCMQKYQYDKIVQAAPEKRPEFLDKGDMMHLMLAEYYRYKMGGWCGSCRHKHIGSVCGIIVKTKTEEGVVEKACTCQSSVERPPHEVIVEKAIDWGRFRVIEMSVEVDVAEDEVIHTFREYCDFWRNDNYLPIAVEQPVITAIWEDPETDEFEGLTVIMEMIVDIIFENQQGHQMWTDHKTRSRNKDANPMSNQFAAYAYISGTNRSMRNNIGFQKTLPAEKKFTRDFFPYNRGMLEWWKDWVIYRAQYIDACIKNNHFPPDLTKCDEYGGCVFIDVCMQSPENRERFLNDNFIKNRRRLTSIFEKE